MKGDEIKGNRLKRRDLLLGGTSLAAASSRMGPHDLLPHSQTLQPAHGPVRAGVKNAYLMGWMTFHAAAFLDTFVEYPPSQSPASFTIDQIEKDVERKIRELATRPSGR
jgi:hypothetical protein